MTQKLLAEIGQYLEKAGFSFEKEEDHLFFHSMCNCPCIIGTAADYWVYLYSITLLPRPVPATPEALPFLIKVLRLNDYTKLGRFFLSEEGHLEFCVDCRIKEFNEDLLLEMINLLDYTIAEEFMPILNEFEHLFEVEY